MILGMGVDVVSVAGFSEMLAAEGTTFRERWFSEGELRYATDAAHGAPEVHLAARWAAKEAALKALDQAAGFGGTDPGEVDPASIEVERDARGRPHLKLKAEAAALAERLGAKRALLSLSHDGDAAVAMVVLERT